MVPGGLLIGIPVAIRHWGSDPVLGVPSWVASAWVLVVCGFGLYLWCAVDFVRRGHGTPNPLDPPRQLVIAGRYRRVRNPMYLGIWIALLGHAVLWPSWPMLGYLVGSVVAVVGIVFGYEEPKLRRQFGAEYREYCANSGRFLPRLGHLPPTQADLERRV